MIDFTSRQLRAFLLAAQHRSFSRAAGALFITPSGLSVSIRELESQLGVRLFDRTSRHVTLTKAGTELLADAQKHLRDLDAALSRVGSSAAKSDLPFSLGIPLIMASRVLPEAIKQFRSLRPGFRIEVFDGDVASIMQKVEAGGLDLGLGIFLKHLPAVQRIPLFRSSLVAIRADAGGTRRRASMAWSSLSRGNLLSLPPSIPLQQFINKRLASAGVARQPSLIVNYLDTLIAMAEAGEGVGIVPSYALAAGRKRDILVSRLVNPVVEVDFHQIRRGGRKLPPAAEEFASFLKTYIPTWAARSGVL